MSTSTVNINTSVAGVNIPGSAARSATGQIGHEVPLPAAKAATGWTKTDNDTGVATLPAGHGIQTGDKVDVYWAGGCRYGMTASVSGNDVTVDLGAGDSLPASSTAVTVAKQVSIDTDFAGDAVKLMAISASRRAHVDIRSTSASLRAASLVADEPLVWWDSSWIANPLSGGAVDSIKASNGDSTAEATLRVGIVYASA
jgi:hypothetical protein